MTIKSFASPKTTALTVILIFLLLLIFAPTAYADAEAQEAPAENPQVTDSTPTTATATSTATAPAGPAESSVSPAAPAATGTEAAPAVKKFTAGEAADAGISESPAEKEPLASEEPAAESAAAGGEEGAASGNNGSGEESAEQEEPAETAAPQAEEAPKGNSFVAEIDRSAIVVSQEPVGQVFTITLTEVGQDNISAATIKLPTGFTDTAPDVVWVQASNGGSWSAAYNSTGKQFELTRDSAADPVTNSQSLSLTFRVNTGQNPGAYEFIVSAWRDRSMNEPNTLLGANPIVIIGHPIGNAEDLAGIPTNELGGLNGYYVQTADLDLAGEGSWQPIGDFIRDSEGEIDSSVAFQGAYHGNGFVIKNLQIEGDNLIATGLFGYAYGATLIDVNLENVFVNVLGDESYGAGALAGGIAYSKVIGAQAQGAVFGVESVGGLIGQVTSESMVTKSSAEVNVEGKGSGVGGLVGYSWGDSIIEFCFASGNVTGEYYVGGLVGSAEHTRVGNSYAAGDVSGFDYVGGLAGGLLYAFDDDNYNYNCPSAVVNCYSTGRVVAASSAENIGGLVGYDQGFDQGQGFVENSFYDMYTSGQSDTGKGEPLSTADMHYYKTYADEGWSVTGKGGCYPWLWWQTTSYPPAYIWHLLPVFHRAPGGPGDDSGLIDVPCDGEPGDLSDAPCDGLKRYLPHHGGSGFSGVAYKRYVRRAYRVRALPQTAGSNLLLFIALGLIALGVLGRCDLRFKQSAGFK